MASTNSTVDGMGFEEIGQVGSQPTNLWIAGSFTDEDGKLRSVSIQNTTDVYGYRVKAGSVLTGNDASGLVHFKTNFADANWFMSVTPRTLTDPYLYQVTDGSGLVPCVSGIRRASGCWVYGGSQTVYDWIAVGL